MAIVSYILGPCPSCGKKSFGNVDVYGSHVLRGCGACEYKDRVPLPPVKKKIIYLDQFFLRVCPGTSSGITKFSEHEAD
jgi:transcription elongation factor Elf1